MRSAEAEPRGGVPGRQGAAVDRWIRAKLGGSWEGAGMQVVVRRPARLPPPQVPRDELLVATPPRLDSGQAGVVGWLQYLVPAIGSLGAVLFVVVNPKPIFIISGLLFALAAVAMGAGMALQQRTSWRRRAALERTRYRSYLAELRGTVRGVAEQQQA